MFEIKVKVEIDLSENVLKTIDALTGSVAQINVWSEKAIKAHVDKGPDFGEAATEKFVKDVIEKADQLQKAEPVKMETTHGVTATVELEPEKKERKPRKTKAEAETVQANFFSEESEAEPAPGVKLPGIMKKIADLVKDAKGKEVKKILNETFGVQKVPELSEDQRQEFYEKICSL